MNEHMVNRLRQVELFSALEGDDLLAVAELAYEATYPRGELVYRQGQPGRRWHLVQEGELRVLHVDTDGIEHEVGRLGPGDSFGQSSLLLGERHDATVEVIEDAVLLVIDKEDFDQLLDDRPWLVDDLQVDPEIERRRRAQRFDWQEPDETIVFVVRKHELILLGSLVLPGILLLLILGAYFLVGSTSVIWLPIGGLLAAGPLLWAVYEIVDHFNDNYILTNRRVMHDEQVFLIRQLRVGAPLDNIQSVQVMQQGILAQLFDFGDLEIQTAGRPRGRITFPRIPEPAHLQQMILEQRDRAEARARAREHATIQEALDHRFNQRPLEEDAPEIDEERPSDEDRESQGWPSWALLPVEVVRYFFPALREEQGDTIIWRKHWIVLLRPIALPTGLIIVTTIVAAILLGGEGSDRVPIVTSYGIVLLFLLPWWLWVFEDWRNEVYEVTPTRMVDIERLPFGLREERREASLGMIQNVNLRVPGVIGRLVGYGSVNIETAGAGAFTFDHVKNPKDVQAEIFLRMASFEERQRQQRAERRRDELLDWFTVYDRMRHPEAEQRGGPVLPRTQERGDGSDDSSTS